MEMQEENDIVQVGLIGGSSSGKTTMLLALEPYARQYRDHKGVWTYQGANADTVEWLNENRILPQNGKFHPGTSVSKNLKFILFRDNTKVCIETQERPGGDYTLIDDGMFEYLSQCAGLIFLINPKPKEDEPRTSDLIRNLLTRIDLKRGGGEATGLPLSHRVAVCLSQYDEVEFFQWLRGKNYLERRIVNGVQDTPFLPAKNVVRAIREWHRFPDGQEILDEFGTRFNPDFVNFYALSSIGFYVKQNVGSVDWEDCSNVVITPSGEGFRNERAYRPVNLLAPLGWILSNEGSGWRGR